MKSAALPHDLPDELAKLWQLARRLGAVMDRRSDTICRSELGISFAHFLVLSVVDAYPGDLNQQAIADRLGLTKGTVSRQLDAATTAGLMTVRPAAHTRRENTVALTSVGTEVVRKGDAALAAARSALTDAVVPDDLHTAVTVLGSLLSAAERAS